MLIVNQLEAALQEIMRGWDVPGLAVGVVAGDELIYAKGFGVQNLKTGAPVSLDTVFCVQSVSKCFVATAVMQWVERGALDLDEPVVTYLPYFRLDDARSRQITLRQMLSHTSGMPDLEETEYVAWMAHPETDEGAAERFVRGLSHRKLVADPGERFSYSNLAYDVLGDLLAKVSGKLFESLMQERILMPCGMPHSTFLWAEIPSDQLAWPHLRSPGMRPNPSYPYHRADAPASFLHTTLIDMCHWAVACLKQGSYLGQRVLSPEGYDRMWTPVVARGSVRPSLYEQIGLGWTLGHFMEQKTVSHGGAGFGGTAFLMILPEKQYAVVILCNEESSAHFQAVGAVGEALLGGEPRAGRVSWMVPVSRALAAGGMEAAADCYAEIKDREDEFYFGEDDLIDLSLQLLTAGNLDLAIGVLGFNTQVFPGHIQSYLEQAKLYLKQGDPASARASLMKALAIEPGNAGAERMLEALP
jgi:CubicO group peptidase (beta-lactamase class C family)